jgi:hypothetical protein
MGKSITILDFFKRKNSNGSEANASDASLPTTNVNIPILEDVDVSIPENVDIPIPENPRTKFRKIDIDLLERDPGLRLQILDYYVNQRDEIRLAYIKASPYQPILPIYRKFGR